MRLPLLALLLCHIAAAAAEVDYQRHIKPLLATACVQCHGADSPKAELRLDTAEALLKSGTVTPLQPEQSALYLLLLGEHSGTPRMPYKRSPLSTEQTELVRQWIVEGAKHPAQEQPSTWSHWAFLPPQRGQASGIDECVSTALAEKGITPQPRAEWSTLLRRLYLDLTGLPPTLAQTEAFLTAVQQQPEAAVQALITDLLASPHYGERWGRWWLDQARYADSNGYSIDAPRSIWPYRDWVVAALNQDMPFDEFTIQQLAGDLLPKPTTDQLVATGFHRNTQVNGEGGIDPEQFRIDAVFDRVATTGTVWLGLTIGCAQCHDHKFDPISQKEYYQLFAFFNNQEQDGHAGTKTSSIELAHLQPNRAALKTEERQLRQQVEAMLPSKLEAIATWESGLTPDAKKKLKREVRKVLDVPVAKRKAQHHRVLYAQFAFNDADFKGLNDRLTEVETSLAAKVTSLTMQELPQPRETRLFIKGDFTRPADVILPGTLKVLPPLPEAKQRTRLELARWLVSQQNPLTARVIMNRVWQVYFGKGLVETENDFGTQGLAPSHPQLLDWLACEFMQHGWSLKHLHRVIVSSATYQRSSVDAPASRERDPLNRYLWRQNRLRMDAELVRDAALRITDLLHPKLGGQPVYPPQPEGAMNVGQVKRPWPTSTGPDRYRRGLYTFFFRASPHPALTVFDAPDSFSTCTRRYRSNTPLQALTLLNDSAFQEFHQALAQLIEKEGLPAAFTRCTSRSPSADELKTLTQLDASTAARVMLNLDETITRE